MSYECESKFVRMEPNEISPSREITRMHNLIASSWDKFEYDIDRLQRIVGILTASPRKDEECKNSLLETVATSPLLTNLDRFQNIANYIGDLIDQIEENLGIETQTKAVN